MLQVLLGIVIGLLGVVTWLWRMAVRDARRNGTSAREELTGICASAVDQTVRKNRNKAEILLLFGQHKELTNADIRKHTGFARRSVVRYMSELEREDKVEQVGESGRFVAYRRK
jgi:Fic family protein